MDIRTVNELREIFNLQKKNNAFQSTAHERFFLQYTSDPKTIPYTEPAYKYVAGYLCSKYRLECLSGLLTNINREAFLYRVAHRAAISELEEQEGLSPYSPHHTSPTPHAKINSTLKNRVVPGVNFQTSVNMPNITPHLSASVYTFKNFFIYGFWVCCFLGAIYMYLPHKLCPKEHMSTKVCEQRALVANTTLSEILKNLHENPETFGLRTFEVVGAMTNKTFDGINTILSRTHIQLLDVHFCCFLFHVDYVYSFLISYALILIYTCYSGFSLRAYLIRHLHQS